MKRLFKYLAVLSSVLLISTSCLKGGLVELPAWDERNITQVNAEWRYTFGTSWTGEPMVYFQVLNRVDQKIDTVNCTVVTSFGLPAINNNRGWTTEEQAKVSLSKLALKLDLSTAAVMKPINGAPVLGTPSDWTKPHQYEVMSASNKTKVWTITVQGIVR